jgi:hypothetical protein
MEQWEYVRLFVARSLAGSLNVSGRSFGLTMHPVVTKGVDVDTAIAQLGQEGWELLSPVGDADKFHLFFKRPKSR